MWNAPSWTVRLLYPPYVSIAQRVRSNRLLTRCLFKARLPKGLKATWDFTTLVLRHALLQRRPVGTRALEVGVGQAALLPIYLARKLGVKADGVDVVADRVQSSRQVARYNSIALYIWQSDLFENVRDKYDLIFFNAAYIPTRFGQLQDITGRGQLDDARAWDGGPNGTDTITRFLAQSPHFLTFGGEILLGVNNFYVSDARISQIVQTSALVLVDRITVLLSPSTVYVLRHKESRDDK